MGAYRLCAPRELIWIQGQIAAWTTSLQPGWDGLARGLRPDPAGVTTVRRCGTHHVPGRPSQRGGTVETCEMNRVQSHWSINYHPLICISDWH